MADAIWLEFSPTRICTPRTTRKDACCCRYIRLTVPPVPRRAMEGLLLAEKEVSESDREWSPGKGAVPPDWLLALTELAKPGQKPCLLLVAGLPGTGKSTLAAGSLKRRASASFARTKYARNWGIPAQMKSSAETRLSLYTPEWNARTYSECMRRAELLLWEGKRAIVDATFREQKERTAFQEMAVRWGVPAGLLICAADPETVRSRLEQRRGDYSDADWPVYLQLAQKWEPVRSVIQSPFQVIPAEGSTEQVLDRALVALERFSLT